MTTKLTLPKLKSACDQAKAEQRRIELADGVVPGLRARCTLAGKATFFIEYRAAGKKRRVTVGEFPAMDLSNIRAKASVVRGEIKSGGDPWQRQEDARLAQVQARKEAEQASADLADRKTVAEVAEAFVRLKEADKIRHAGKYRRMLEYNLTKPTLPAMKLGLGDKPIAEFSADDIDKVLTAMSDRGAPGQARRMFEVIRPMMRHAKRKGWIEVDPVERVTAPARTGKRDRYLCVSELRAVWMALDGWELDGIAGREIPLPLASVRILALQLLLAQRSGEVAGMQRHEISPDGYFWTIPGERTKNKHPTTVPLPPRARQIIEAAGATSKHTTHVFPARIRASETANAIRSDVISTQVGGIQEHFGFTDERGQPNPWTAHDLRRTVATYLSKMSIADVVRDAILNHVTGKHSSVAETHYNQDDRLLAMREALTRWEATLADIAEGIDPFMTNAEAFEDLEQRIISRQRGPRMVAIKGGRA